MSTIFSAKLVRSLLVRVCLCVCVGMVQLCSHTPISSFECFSSCRHSGCFNPFGFCFAAGLSVFGAFLRSEFSEENLQFYLSCEQYRHSSNNFSLQRRARDICATFIQPGAPREVTPTHPSQPHQHTQLTGKTPLTHNTSTFNTQLTRVFCLVLVWSVSSRSIWTARLVS